jgi:hypothetical protein
MKVLFSQALSHLPIHESFCLDEAGFDGCELVVARTLTGHIGEVENISNSARLLIRSMLSPPGVMKSGHESVELAGNLGKGITFHPPSGWQEIQFYRWFKTSLIFRVPRSSSSV